MSTQLLQSTPATHPQLITGGERDRLQEDIQRVLLQVPSAGDQKVIDRKHDIRKGFNRVHATLSQLLVHAFNNGRAEICEQFVNAIGDFFSARTQGAVRLLKELFEIETKEEGELNVIQMAIAQGDRSTPMLIRLITAIDQIVAVLLEIRAAAVKEVQQVADATCGGSSNG
ncbi:MAG: hypothetical protein ACJ8AK_02935 [Gemmatimonadaceae bacterium]